LNKFSNSLTLKCILDENKARQYFVLLPFYVSTNEFRPLKFILLAHWNALLVLFIAIEKRELLSSFLFVP